MRFQNGFNKVAIELRVVQCWSEIILVISNRTRAACSFDFEITRMISDQIALHLVQLPLYICLIGFDILVGEFFKKNIFMFCSAVENRRNF